MSEMSTESQPSEEPSMSVPAVSALLTKQLCMHGGRLLVSEIPQLLNLKPEHIASILREGAHRFAEPQTGTLLAHSTVRLCAAYLRENCQATDCERLHLCRFFILGRCFRNRHGKCKFSHDCRSEVNRAVLKANEIANLNEKELRVLLLLNDAALLPEVCREYKGEKKDGSCTKGAECGRLHVCLYFVRGQCRYYRCNRSHDLLEPNPMRLLQGRGLSEEMIRNIQLMRIHLCNEARKEPWKEEPPRKDNNRDHPHSTTDTSHTKTAAPTKRPQTDKLDGREPADPSPSPSSAISTKYRRTEPSSESHRIDNSHAHVFVSPPPQPTIGVTKHPVTTPCTGILPTDKPNDRKSVSSPPPPAATVTKYPSTTLRTVILPTDKPNDRRSVSPSPPTARTFSAYSMTTPHPGMLPDKPDDSKSVNPPPLTRTVSTNPASTARTGILLTDKPDERASVSSVFQPDISPRTVAPKAHGDRSEICIYHIWKFCEHQNKCPQMHYHLPYRWQISKGAGKWEDLPWMEDIEKAYSDPNNTSSGQHDINFEKMTSAYHEVRRLSTASSVTKPPDYLMTTEWVWHWKNEHRKWIEYGNHGGKEKAMMASADLETIYLADKNAVVPFQAGAQQYHLNFPDMIQTNLRYRTQKEVRRRPRFVSKEAVDKLNSSGRTTSPVVQTSSPVQGIPVHWDRTALPDVGFQLVNVGDGSAEFKGVQRDFKKTMPTYSINKMKKIQNPFLWKLYQCQMEQMNKVNEGEKVLEKKLFHGTDTAHVEAICHDNFDWRICGTHGTMYGKGSYFARDAHYSHRYCNSSSSRKTMFVARVLVGDFVVGNSDYLRPPPKPTIQNNLYDSCVDNELDPSIFVIFEKTQIYPEYILEYSKTTPHTSKKTETETKTKTKTEESTCCIS